MLDGVDAPTVVSLVDSSGRVANRAVDHPFFVIGAPYSGLNTELGPTSPADSTFIAVLSCLGVEAWFITVGAERRVTTADTGDFFERFLLLGIAALFAASVLPFPFGFTRGH